MLSIEKILSFDKNDLQEVSKTINRDDLPQLVEWLSEKDDAVRYPSFLLLKYRSLDFDDVYNFWDAFCEKLRSENSYQRSIGLMLIAENAKWDKDDRLDAIIDEYLLHLNDEKPITIRQCIQALQKIIPFKNHLHMKIANKLMAIEISNVKETMRKLVLIDILSVLAMIRKYQTNDEIESYIFDALNGGLLDKKAKIQVESML